MLPSKRRRPKPCPHSFEVGVMPISYQYIHKVISYKNGTLTDRNLLNKHTKFAANFLGVA